jgi:hypothetical protein
MSLGRVVYWMYSVIPPGTVTELARQNLVMGIEPL